MFWHRIHRFLDRAQSRFVRSRPGSILILVIVLLVLMALLGTAFLVTARTDRVASKLYMQNRQIDLLVEGVKNMALAAMTNNSQRYDDWYTTGTNGTVDHTWLASRYPYQFQDAEGTLSGTPISPVPIGAVVTNGSPFMSTVDQNMNPVGGAGWAPFVANWNSLQPVWPAITGPLVAGGYFEDPRSPSVSVNPIGQRTLVSPTYLTINGMNYPALQYSGGGAPALAASASGNGIADSFLWRLPMSTTDGVTYYAAVRIIDNNSAIDANTALSSSFDYDYLGNAIAGTSPYQPGLFPSGIGLTELLYSYSAVQPQPAGAQTDVACQEMTILNRWRFAGAQSPQGILNPSSAATPGPLDDNPAARKDFFYATLGDALTMTLGRRSFNPGYAAFSSGTGQARAFTWGDAAALAYKFDLVNSAGPGTLESCLFNSTYDVAGTPRTSGAVGPPTFRSTPWDPSQVWDQKNISQLWFNTYNETVLPPLFPNRRPYITAHSNLSNLMPAVAMKPFNQNASDAINNTTYLSNTPPDDIFDFVQRYMVGNLPYSSGATVPRCSINTAYVTALDAPAQIGQTVSGPTLWYSFYQAMLGALQPVVTYSSTNPLTANLPAAVSPILRPQWGAHQFRSPIRDNAGASDSAAPTGPRYWLTGPETLVLRSLLAACNAKDLRDGDDIPTTTIVTGMPVSKLSVPSVNVFAYGLERQPFIVEVYANNDTSKQPDKTGSDQHSNPNKGMINPNGYVAVELYNPYDTPILIENWTLGIMNRSTYPNLTMTEIPLARFPGGCRIPARSYLILENMSSTNANGGDATFRPWLAYPGASTMVPPPVPPVPPPAVPNTAPPANAPPNSTYTFYEQNLNQVMAGGELYLLRPPTGPGLNIINTPVTYWIPADSFDFSGMTSTATIFSAIHYARPNPGWAPPSSASPIPTEWKFVYPGKWDGAGNRFPLTPTAVNPVGQKKILPAIVHQEGIAVSTWDSDPLATPIGYDWWIDPVTALGPNNPNNKTYIQYKSSIAFGQPIGLSTSSGTYIASYINNFGPIQISNREMPGPNKFSGSTSGTASTPPTFTTPINNIFPFGGFARVGDVLSVPFIGSYAIYTPNNAGIIEMNPVTRDAALADDDDNGQDDALEQIGRFCPIAAAQQPTENILPTYATALSNYDRYGFAAHVLEYFSTINNPNDDYLPNIDPNTYALAYGANTGPAPFFAPMAVSNTLSSAAGGPNKGTEDTVPIEGLINVNTANWRALAAVPFIPTASANAIKDNQMIARSIVAYRNTYGPFKTLFDLNKVPLTGIPLINNTQATTLQSYYGDPSKSSYDVSQGDISPSTPAIPNGVVTDGVTNDFETRFGMINRVSNLLTTRSDTFTVYLVVQGWRGVGTSTPQIALQRRAAFIVDRSQITPTNGTMNITPIQSN